MSEIPVFDCFVPGSGDEDLSCLAGDIDHADAPDGLVVRSYLCCLGAAGAEVEKPSCFVRTTTDYFCAVLVPAISSDFLISSRTSDLPSTNSNSKQAPHVQKGLFLHFLLEH